MGYHFGLLGKKNNINTIQMFQNITFCKIINVPLYVFNQTLHKDLDTKTVKEEVAIFYKRFFSQL